ncbi:MAG: nicotinate-nucleotide adenylyltransferase [Lachnospiraceae bacterium]|nr:nicotinate-nucleotide adenylyltransferase [Lachnospiraceae bacterium]
MKKKTGILGGTFNPIHKGHIAIGKSAYTEYGLDRVLFMPTGVSYLKDQSEILSPQIRAEMVSLAIEDEPGFELSTYEIEKGGNTYTCETLEYLTDMGTYGDLYFITGADTLFSIDSWYRPELIMKLCHILVAVRDEHSGKEYEERTSFLKERFDAKISLLHCDKIDISSSLIRQGLKEGRDVSGMLPEKVYRYITDNSLYM